MAIQTDFKDAAQRLVADAVMLWEVGTKETASHLAGVSAESALKSLLAGMGVIVLDTHGEPTLALWRAHLDDRPPKRKHLWNELHAHLSGPLAPQMLSLLPPATPEPFAGWELRHRYVRRGGLGEEQMEAWMYAAIAVCHAHEVAISVGIVP